MRHCWTPVSYLDGLVQSVERRIKLSDASILSNGEEAPEYLKKSVTSDFVVELAWITYLEVNLNQIHQRCAFVSVSQMRDIDSLNWLIET